MTNSCNHGGDKNLSSEERDAIMEEMLKIDFKMLRSSAADARVLNRHRLHLADELTTGRRLPLHEDVEPGVRKGRYRYFLTARNPELGAGWDLKLFEDNQEAGGGVFPVPFESDTAGMTWFNACTEEERLHWLQEAKSARPADARTAYLLAEAYADAENVACDWLDSKTSP